MPSVSALPLVRQAEQDGYAVAALDVETCDMALAVIQAAGEAHAPMILQVTPRTLDALGWRWLARHMRDLCDEAPVPVAFQLDHALSLDQALQAGDLGFTSVMYDGSALLPDANAYNTALVVERARNAGLSVEGEIGHVGRDGEDPHLAYLSTAEEARTFLDRTGVDMLAVAVGTRHGHTPGPGGIDLTRLASIHSSVATPLVLHGGSGVDDTALGAAIAAGIRKVNVGTAFKKAYLTALTLPAESPRDVVVHTMRAVRAQALSVFRSTKSAGRVP